MRSSSSSPVSLTENSTAGKSRFTTVWDAASINSPSSLYSSRRRCSVSTVIRYLSPFTTFFGSASGCVSNFRYGFMFCFPLSYSYRFLPYFENGNLWQKSVLPQVPLHFLFGFQNNCLIRTQFSCPRCCAALWIVADQYICSRKGFRNRVLLLLFCKIAHHEEFLVA